MPSGARKVGGDLSTLKGLTPAQVRTRPALGHVFSQSLVYGLHLVLCRCCYVGVTQTFFSLAVFPSLQFHLVFVRLLMLLHFEQQSLNPASLLLPAFRHSNYR